MQAIQFLNNRTVMKTLLAAKLFDGFWDRWITHGIDQSELAAIRPSFSSDEQWARSWQRLADNKVAKALASKNNGAVREAEVELRTASLYYQMIAWLIPWKSTEKAEWLNTGVTICKQADRLSPIQTRYESVQLKDGKCIGRVRVPHNPKGAVIMVNPFDSTKEELFTYEMDFLDDGYAVMNFDGPGQGQTFSNQGFRATDDRWRQYVDRMVQYAGETFPELPIHLFGTSSGASWALYGSGLPGVSKVVAVSPAFPNDDIQLPDYFFERTRHLMESGETILPPVDNLAFRKPVFLIHGKKDVMVSEKKIYELYDRLPEGKRFLEYEDEAHCCNYKLPEIRDRSMKWFQT
ncbi:MAG TPA: alpha/beta fold hydrolase [Bacillales bacterium]